MSNSSPGLEKGEFFIVIPNVVVCAPIRLTDDQGEKLFNDVKPELVSWLGALKDNLEEKFPDVRVGFSVT